MFARCAFRFGDDLTQKAAPILGSKKRPENEPRLPQFLRRITSSFGGPPFGAHVPGPKMGAALRLHFANKRAPPALRRNCGRSVLATASTLRPCATHDGRLHAAHVQQLGRPVHTASDYERFLDPVLGAARLRQVAKPKRRSAPIELQTKAVWPNVRGVIFVARDTRIQGPYSATPPVRY